MAKNTLTVSNFIRCAKALPKDISVLIRGDHGIGKSAVARQLATQLGFKAEDIIDRRLSQQTEGDMIGLPSTDGEVTRFNPPEWIKAACLTPKFLFLDELNRATTEVMQAAFQLVLDRELNGWKLHPDSRVYAAINTSSQYTVNEVDPALLDRFWVVDLAPTASEWCSWAREATVPDVIIDFIAKHEKWLDPPVKAEQGTVNTSRRSWARLGEALKNAGVVDEPNEGLFYQLSVGFCGVEAASALVDYAKNNDLHVEPADLIKSWIKVQPKVAKMGQEKLNGLIEKVSDYLNEHHAKKGLTDKQATNVGEFMGVLPHELRLNFWSKLTVKGADALPLVKSIHPHTVKHILDVFGVPLGASGPDVQVNIPDFLQNKK